MIRHKKILLLSPHIDDVEIGCGGSVAKWIEEENEIYWVVFSSAEASVPAGYPKDALKKEFGKVYENLKLSKAASVYDYPVRRFPEYRQDILERMCELRTLVTPDLVVGPSLNDTHQDHSVIAQEMVRAYRGCSIISYQMPRNQLLQNPQMYVKLHDRHMKKKIKMIDTYETQKVLERTYMTEEYIRGLAMINGVNAGCKYAEAFDVIKLID